MSRSSYGKRLGELIRKKRYVQGLTQLQLSEDAFGTAAKVRRISDLENGVVANPHAKTVDPIIVQLGISEAELAACMEDTTPPDADLDCAYREARSLIDALAYQFDYDNPDAGLSELDAFLRAKASEWRALRARLDDIDASDAEVKTEKNRALEALANGKLDEVDAILAALEERFQQRRTLVEVAKQAEIRIARADTCLMNGESDAAITHYLQAARFFEPFSREEALGVLEDNAHRIYEGSLRSLRPYFTVGSALLENALESSLVVADPVRRAAISYQLSLMYRNASLKTAGGDHKVLRARAISNARNAEAYAAEAGKPYQLVITKISLANCLLDGARKDAEREELNEAIGILRSAKVIATEQADARPVLSHVCNSLGSVLLTRASEHGEAPPAEVIEDALKHFTDAAESAETYCNFDTWGAAKANRAHMLASLAERAQADDPQKTFLFMRAIGEYLTAIETFPETLFPDRFAETHMSLARVFSQLSGVIQDARAEGYMVRAINSLETASVVFETLAPDRWAQCQMHIGSIIATHGLSEFSNDPESDFEEAIRRFQCARDAFDERADVENVASCDRAIKRLSAECEQLSSRPSQT